MEVPFREKAQKQTAQEVFSFHYGPLPKVEKGVLTHGFKPHELRMLLLRPSISKIFLPENKDDAFIDADAIITSFGMFDAKSMKKWVIERIPILYVSESATLGYTFPMRLDLHLCLKELAEKSKGLIDFPLGLFTDRDVIVVSDGIYTVDIGYRNPQEAARASNHGMGNFEASHLVYYCTTTEEGMMKNLRRLEATARYLLAPEPTTPPTLPPEIIDGWQHNFLEPIFERVKKNLHN